MSGDQIGLEFPTSYSLKVFTNNETESRFLIEEVLERQKIDISTVQVKTRKSRAGRYTAITVTFVAVSRIQLEQVYFELNQDPGILFSM